LATVLRTTICYIASNDGIAMIVVLEKVEESFNDTDDSP
jgi:hypothetical protein